MKRIFKCLIIFILLICSFVALLTLTSCISSKSMVNNVEKSSQILLKEGNRKIIYIPYRKTKMEFDNYTDALMINTAYSIDSRTPLFSAFVARKNFIPDITTEIYQDQAGELRSSSKYKYHNEVGELNDLINNEKAESFEYARYWHGYLIILRPLLVMFNLTQIRMILTCILITLFIIFTILLYKRTDIITAIIFFTSLLGVEYFYLGFSMQGIFVFLIMMIASIIILCKYSKIKNYSAFFFIIGMLTNFFDFLTVPILTYTIPMIVLFTIKYMKENFEIKLILKEILVYGITWGIGYGLTWASKWILTDLIFGRNMFLTALKQVFYRSAGTEKISIFNVINQNINYMYISFFISIFFTVLTILIKIWIEGKKFSFKEQDKKIHTYNIILIYLLIGIIPYIWYTLLRNHSYYHAFFTYRNLLISNICINLSIKKIFDFLTERKEKNEKEI